MLKCFYRLLFRVQYFHVCFKRKQKRLALFANINEETNVSEQCLKDVDTFVKDLRNFTTTLVKCRQNGGCTEEQKEILKENMYAVEEIDAFGKLPAGIMELTLISSGSYSECTHLVAPYDVHYCYATATFDNKVAEVEFTRKDAVESKNSFQTSSAIGMTGIGVKIAVCMPKSCSEEDIPKVLDTINLQGVIPLTFVDSTCVPTSVKPTTAFWIFMGFMAFFVIWALAASAIDFYMDVYMKKAPRQTKALRILLSFSVYSNGAAILETSPHKEGTLKSLASIRFISMTWVAAGHTLGQNAINDAFRPVLTLWNPFLSTTITNAFLSVDTFFLLSGILVSYLFFKSKPSSKFVKNPLVWVMFYVHRYLRLTPPIMIFIGFYTVVLPFFNGPWAASVSGIMGTLEDSVQACQKQWWHNALYINNFFGNIAECYPVTWYLAVDTQLYFVAPIFLITLALKPILGAILLVLCAAGSIAYVYVITFRDNLPATVFGAFAFQKTTAFFSEYYEKPWTRCTPYLVGIAVGYLLARGKKPRIHWLTASSAWALATAVAVASLYGPHGYIKGDDNWSEFTRGTYNNFSRIGWALAVSWVIVANHLGWGGPVATFMDHPLWKPLGRLSYCAYIVHYFVIHYVFNLDDRPAHYVSIWQTYVYRVIPVVALSYTLAFIWSCLFESPIIKLEKIFMRNTPSAKDNMNSKPFAVEKDHERIYAYGDPHNPEPQRIRL
ncbi:acyltransferase [Oesophagostomum dentatum]|uniref:Acyltransferase n=1 Tax=Oesophagostomum dentatum TaxID=61180 RepID=A0A0B1TAT4_OESDE|nr:acyltransferase [Oesophagostomum dentatum]